MPHDELRRVLGIEAALLGDLIGRWQRDGAVVREGGVVRLPSHGAAVLSPDERWVADRALNDLRAGGGTPPELRQVGVSVELGKALERLGELVFTSRDIAYPADVWRDIERRVVDLIARGGPATVAQVRDAVGTTRKYAVPLLERLDATGVTRRKGDVRELGPRGTELAANR
jgi:selenocysteine-specific elongation factor